MRWCLPALLAGGLGLAALLPAPAKAGNDDLVRVLVDVADVIYRSGQPYYRYGNYGYNDRVIIVRDRYRRPSYYRYVPRTVVYRAPPRGNAYGYYRNSPRAVRYVSYRDYDRHDDHRHDRDRHDRHDRYDRDRHDDRRGKHGRGRD
ncbi:hypothetical protein ABB29_12380 [Pseudoxanthomonas dokdonensis]|uniref:Uncharacterized protein n=2 Tax=Pseudoxanthomonas dokdonensis TaxID=344882 RepID=A0A0R0CFN8_9GAMM|nr:hypothetical protein ABB29_12380 [Pseudoxanthomonas dokdonensis]